MHRHLKKSGEPLIPLLKRYTGTKDPILLFAYQDLVLRALKYEEQYADYWRSTADQDGENSAGHVSPTRMGRDFEIFIKLIGRFLSTQGKKSMPLLCPSVRALPWYRASCTPLVSHGRGPA